MWSAVYILALTAVEDTILLIKTQHDKANQRTSFLTHPSSPQSSVLAARVFPLNISVQGCQHIGTDVRADSSLPSSYFYYHCHKTILLCCCRPIDLEVIVITQKLATLLCNTTPRINKSTCSNTEVSSFTGHREVHVT